MLMTLASFYNLWRSSTTTLDQKWEVTLSQKIALQQFGGAKEKRDDVQMGFSLID